MCFADRGEGLARVVEYHSINNLLVLWFLKPYTLQYITCCAIT